MTTTSFPVSLCPTGMVQKKEDNPNVPISAHEIIEDVKRCHEIGITSVHIHARHEDETPAWEKFYFEKIVSGIRSFNENIVICVTTSGRDVQEIEKRSDVLTLAGECKPDMASLTLSSMNFLNQASVNDPSSIQTLAKMMLDLDIKPELEIFDMGMINYANYLIKKNLLKPPYVINLLLGNISGLQPEFLDLGLALERIPKPSIHLVAGLGSFQRQSNILGILSDGGVRVGLEDNIFTNHETKKLASNKELLHGVNEIAKALGKKIMTGQEFKLKYLSQL
jgi:3-keto-5-aminohexanoate cleavage enzyme